MCHPYSPKAQIKPITYPFWLVFGYWLLAVIGMAMLDECAILWHIKLIHTFGA